MIAGLGIFELYELWCREWKRWLLKRILKIVNRLIDKMLKKVKLVATAKIELEYGDESKYLVYLEFLECQNYE